MKDDGRLYVAIAYYRDCFGKPQEIRTSPFALDSMDDMDRTYETIGDVARARLLLTNSWEPIPNLDRIEIYVLEYEATIEP